MLPRMNGSVYCEFFITFIITLYEIQMLVRNNYATKRSKNRILIYKFDICKNSLN